MLIGTAIPFRVWLYGIALIECWGGMPTYIAPSNPDCRIDCPGAGGAAFIPPYTCVRWCGDPEPLSNAFAEALQREGWQFQSTMHAVLQGRQVGRIAETIRRHGPSPWPLRWPFATIIRISREYEMMDFEVVWPLIRFGSALRILAIIMSNRRFSQ